MADDLALTSHLFELRMAGLHKTLNDELGVEEGSKIIGKIENGMDVMQFYNNQQLQTVPESQKDLVQTRFIRLMSDMTRPQEGKSQIELLQELADQDRDWYKQKAIEYMDEIKNQLKNQDKRSEGTRIGLENELASLSNEQRAAVEPLVNERLHMQQQALNKELT